MSIITAKLTRVVTVADTNLFEIAAREYGDATQWNRIARANGLTDPFITGELVELRIPPNDPSGGNGGVLDG